LLPAAFDGTYSAAQIQGVITAGHQSAMFPQSRLDGVGSIPCGRWGQLDWYDTSTSTKFAKFNSLGSTLEWVNGEPEDVSIYVNHSWVYGGTCTTSTTTTSTTTSTTTTTPLDVCSNIDGIQSVVPDGYTLVKGEFLFITTYTTTSTTTTSTTTTSTTTTDPTDVCPNLDGNQATVPDGYSLVDGECLTAVTLGVSSTDTPSSPTPTLTEVVLAATGAGGTTGGVALALSLVLGGLGVMLLRRQVNTEI
jgi:hypothetical protein